jgi:hypothetical protein
MSNSTTVPAVAVETGQAWMALLDRGSYSEAWKKAAASMHDCISQADFDEEMQALRGPLGKVKSRDIKSQRQMTNPTGLPEGDYCFLSYTTTFENKPNVAETLMLELEPDGIWRIAAYSCPDD